MMDLSKVLSNSNVKELFRNRRMVYLIPTRLGFNYIPIMEYLDKEKEIKKIDDEILSSKIKIFLLNIERAIYTKVKKIEYKELGMEAQLSFDIKNNSTYCSLIIRYNIIKNQYEELRFTDLNKNLMISIIKCIIHLIDDKIESFNNCINSINMQLLKDDCIKDFI